MTKRSKAPARALAVLALIGGFVIVVVVISAALSAAGTPTTAGRAAPPTPPAQQPAKETPKIYVVEDGDTLTAIAHETGVPVATILRLNPEVDPQILISGEELKLR